MENNIYSFSATDINGNQVPMSTYKDKVLLIVNTASECGFTPQYQALESLYQRYKDRGFAVLGFPCNQFGAQEKADEAAIASFCELNFGVTFPLFAKIEVNGDKSHPLYRCLKSSAKGLLGSESIKWNFTKFLVDRDGRVIDRFAPTRKPETLVGEIEALLK
jgi:glutathione peroxidase